MNNWGMALPEYTGNKYFLMSVIAFNEWDRAHEQFNIV